jgi:hypothetical protein
MSGIGVAVKAMGRQGAMNLMKNRIELTGLAVLALVLVCLAPGLRAQAPASPEQGQPARAVRLSYVDGPVKLLQGNQVLAEQAAANTPLLEGMELDTADNGRAEIQFEDGSVARLAPSSSLTLKVLSGSGASADAVLVLGGGLAYFEFQGGNLAGQIKVQFGDSVATTSGFTVLRVTMDGPPGKLAVFSGNAHLESGNGALAVDLHGGESIARNSADPSGYQVAETIEPDSWDSWNSDRDQALTAEAATQTGAPSNLGQSQNPAWNDLDANGNWYNVPGQGYVWSPYGAAGAGFDPFGYGNWMYTPGYGYLWISGYPWGYLPYQCGNWNFYNGFGWGWAPGMGGCMPWWGLGFYGGPNIGFAPNGYRPLPRPILPRGAPIPRKPIPMIAVNRHATLVTSGLPARDKNTPVTIAGSTVQPLRPLASRPVYDRTAAPGNRSVQTPGGQARSPSSGSSSSHSSGAPSHSSGSSGGGSHSSGGGGGGGGGHSGGGGGGGGGGGHH